MSERLLNDKEVAEILNIGRKTLQRWRKMDPPRGPKWVRIGKVGVRYEPEAVDEYIRLQKEAQ